MTFLTLFAGEYFPLYKTIPLPLERECMIPLTERVEEFIKWMRWKALQLLEKLDNSGKENCGIITRKCPLCLKELINFKSDLMKMIKSIEFGNVKCTFQTILISDRHKKHKVRRNLLIPADESRKIYILPEKWL